MNKVNREFNLQVFGWKELSAILIARENAQKEGKDGLKYANEQADYGIDVTPYRDVEENKIRTTAVISYGIRNYLRHTYIYFLS